MSKKRKTPLYLYSSDFSISGLQVAEILLQKNFPCWRKKKRGKDDFFFLNFALPCFDFVCFLETVLLPDLCGYFFLMKQICVDMRSSIAFSCLTLMKTLTTLPSPLFLFLCCYTLHSFSSVISASDHSLFSFSIFFWVLFLVLTNYFK